MRASRRSQVDLVVGVHPARGEVPPQSDADPLWSDSHPRVSSPWCVATPASVRAPATVRVPWPGSVLPDLRHKMLWFPPTSAARCSGNYSTVTTGLSMRFVPRAHGHVRGPSAHPTSAPQASCPPRRPAPCAARRGAPSGADSARVASRGAASSSPSTRARRACGRSPSTLDGRVLDVAHRELDPVVSRRPASSSTTPTRSFGLVDETLAELASPARTPRATTSRRSASRTSARRRSRRPRATPASSHRRSCGRTAAPLRACAALVDATARGAPARAHRPHRATRTSLRRRCAGCSTTRHARRRARHLGLCTSTRSSAGT